MLEVKNAYKAFGYALLKSLGWNIIIVPLGLLQLIFLFLLTHIGFITNFDNQKIYRDCVILFFCSVHIANSSVEFFFAKKRLPKLLEGFLCYILPIVLISYTVILYCGNIGYSEAINVELLKKDTNTCLILSIIYSLIFHTLKFNSWKLTWRLR
ncbi:hypothetical protein R83H12_02462 [Fibrobacteria bacterium R8-3-H12]